MHKPPKQGKKSREGGGDLKPRRGGREGNQEKPYTTRTSRHATLTKLPVQRKQNVGTWHAHAPQQHTAGQEFAPMLTNNGKRNKRKHSYATALQTANTPSKNAKNTRDHSS